MAITDNTIAYMAAVRTILLADATIQSLGVTQIYDRALPNLAAPYITIGATSDQDWSTATEDGHQLRMDISIWDASASQTLETLRSRQLIAQVRTLLHYASISPAAPSRAVLTRVIAVVGPMLDPDGITLHSVLTVQAFLDHT